MDQTATAVDPPSTPAPTATRWASLLTTQGRAARPFRVRVGAAFAVIAALHVIGLGLLAAGVSGGGLRKPAP